MSLQMKRIDGSYTQGIQPENAYESEVEVATQDVSEWIIIPADINNVSCTLLVQNTGTAKVEAYTGPVINAVNDTVPAAEIVPSSIGSQSDGLYPITYVPVTAIRLNNEGLTGNSKLTVRAQ